jgi:hypothetical protein
MPVAVGRPEIFHQHATWNATGHRPPRSGDDGCVVVFAGSLSIRSGVVVKSKQNRDADDEHDEPASSCAQ